MHIQNILDDGKLDGNSIISHSTLVNNCLTDIEYKVKCDKELVLPEASIK